MRRLLVLGLVVGCASAGSERQNTDVDASGGTDGKPIDAGIDAPAPCVEIMTELLVNPAFDATPRGTGWMEMPINASFPLITDQGNTGTSGISEQSAPYQAWLGGLPNGTATTTDVLWQDVVIPARTRLINFSGFYEVRSGDSTTVANDTASVAWVTTGNSPIATIKALDNTMRTTTFTTVNYGLTNAAMYSGMTLRLRFTSSNNPGTSTTATSFFFDTLSVKATHCMP
jgi:hypothetical protein